MKKFFYILIAVLLGFFSGYFSLTLLVSSGKVEVPEIKGKDIVQANHILKEKGLYIRIDGEEYSDLPSGVVFKQNPPAGTIVKKGREIGVIISKGLKFPIIPDVVEMEIEEAEKILSEKGIPIEKVIYLHSDKYPKNKIIAQRPEPQEGGKSIKLIVSLGKRDEE